jgi:hypothetical protein
MGFPILAHAEVVDCRNEIWNQDACTLMITAFKRDPYPYLTLVTKTVSAASIAIQSGASRGLVASWNDKMWDVIVHSNSLTGYLEAQKQDPRQVRVKDPYSANPENVPAFSGCYFLRDLVIDDDNDICDTFLEPTARQFYLAMAAFNSLCGNVSEARKCEALAPYYKVFLLSDPEGPQ